MSMTREGLRISIPRRKPSRWFGAILGRDDLRDVRQACNAALKRRGLDAGALLRPQKKKGARG